MSRRAYQQMANARGALNNRTRGPMSDKEQAEIAQEQARTRALRERHAMPIERIQKPERKP